MKDSPFVETEIIAGKRLVKGSTLRPVDGLWPIERVCVPELAMLFWEKLNPGRHPAAASDEDRARYVEATEFVLSVLEREDNVRLYPSTRRLDEVFTRARLVASA